MDTNELCGSTPEDLASSFPFKEINFFGYQLYLRELGRLWAENCECVPCKPSYKGGRCNFDYILQFRMTKAGDTLFGTRGQVSLKGKIVSITTEIGQSFGYPAWIVRMKNDAGQEISSSVYIGPSYGFPDHGEPYDLQAVLTDPNQLDECPDPLPPLPPPPRPPFNYPPPNVIAPPPPPPPPPKPCACPPAPPPKVIEKERIIRVPVEKIIRVPVEKIIRVPVEKIIKIPFLPTLCKCPPPPKPPEPCAPCPPPDRIDIPIFDRCENEQPKFRNLRIEVPHGQGASILQLFRRIATAYKCEEEVKFNTVSVRIFSGCDGGAPRFNNVPVTVIKGTEAQVTKQFEELYQIRAQECSQVEIQVTVYDKCENNVPRFKDEKIKVPKGAELQTQKEFFELAQLRAQDCRLGLSTFPVDTPLSLLSYTDTQIIRHETPLDLFTWFIKQVDALVGQFPIEIEIEDADPTQEGNQTKKVELPNISEALAELYGLAITGSTNSDVAINMLMRLVAEMIGTKNATLITQDYVKANASYLGYKGNPKKREIDYSFDPTKLDTLDQLLKESKGYIQGWEEDDKNSVAEYLQKLMFASGVIKAAFFRDSKLIQQMQREVEDLAKGGESNDNQAWEDFKQQLNDPLSEYNKGTDNPQPRIKDTPFTETNDSNP
jgi:hypothetical protein